MRKLAMAIVLAWMLQGPSVPACSLCGSMARNNSLAHEFEQASVIVYGRLANPKLVGNAGAGTTEFHIDQVIKDDPAFPKQKTLLLNRYLPILDAKTQPKWVIFIRSPKDSLQPYWGKEITTTAVLDFVAELHRLHNDPEKRLLHAGKNLDHADTLVADEAFLVFAKADDKLIAQHAKKLEPAKLRKLLKDPDMEPERLSMFAYLLGACGNADDAELLRSQLKNPQSRHFKAFEGILAGYIALQPKEGWAFMHEVLKNDKQSFLMRYAAMRTMRFFYNAHPEEAGTQVMAGEAQAIAHGDIADIAIQDLRKWKRWDHSTLIFSCWDKKSHRSSIVRQSIVRYALACPQPDAKLFLERARRQDAELVRDMEAELK